MQTIRGACLVLAIAVLPGTAWAACRDRDLEGTYELRAESTGDFGTVTTTCKISVSREGTIEGGAACALKNSEGAEAEAKVDGGEVSISRYCRVSGQIMIDGKPSLITEAQMNRDKTKVTGSGTNSVDGSNLSFSATRQAVAVVTEEDSEPKWRRWWWKFWN